MAAHYAEFYGGNKAALARNVALYVERSLNEHGTAVIIATADHREAFYRGLAGNGIDLQAMVNSGRIVFLDAHETLARIMLDGKIDRDRFFAFVGPVVREARAIGPVAAYGEMVGILWQRGDCDAAIALERAWNDLLAEIDFTLYCAYPIDIFEGEFNGHTVDEILCSHTELVPSGSQGELAAALDQAMKQVLDDRLEGLRPLMKPNHRPAWGTLPEAETLILWLRNNVPKDAERIINSVRAHYGAA